jgi:3-oxoacyl-[acyl-carrier-protein] synthase III
MLIKDIAVSLPSRIVTNEEVVDLIRFHSKEYEGDLDKALRTINILLKKSGLIHRHWCADHEMPIDHVAMATRQALSETYLRPEQIELFIFVGIGRGFLEPGNSYMMASALGFRNAECFDVIDACMSWTRAMSLVDSLFKAGKYKNALIVNAEFNMFHGGPLYPSNFALKNQAQLEYTFPSFTIGEAATATLLLAKEPDNFSFSFHAKPETADLCTIPTHGYEGFCHPSEKIGRNGEFRFTSYGYDLHELLEQELPIELNKLPFPKKEIDIVFTHASSKAAWHRYGEKAGIADKIFHIYQNTGNLVSASIPAALSLAKKSGRLKRDDKVLCWVGSAGMSFNISSFKF